MNQYHHSTEPKPRRNPLDQGPRNVVALYQVIDTSDGDAVIDTFRRRALAEKLADSMPTYRVREYSLV